METLPLDIRDLINLYFIRYSRENVEKQEAGKAIECSRWPQSSSWEGLATKEQETAAMNETQNEFLIFVILGSFRKSNI